MDDETRNVVGARLGRLIKAARKEMGLRQEDVALLVSQDAEQKLSQPTVSDHEKGIWSKAAIVDFVGSYGHVLRIDEPALRAALGHPVPGARTAPTFEDVVRADPNLDDKSKEHIINQYGLLRAATLHNRGQHPA